MAVFYDPLSILHTILIYYAKITGIHPVSLVKWLGGRTCNQEVLSSYPIQDFKEIYTFAKIFEKFVKKKPKKPAITQTNFGSEIFEIRCKWTEAQPFEISNFDLDHPVSRGKELLVHEKDSVQSWYVKITYFVPYLSNSSIITFLI